MSDYLTDTTDEPDVDVVETDATVETPGFDYESPEFLEAVERTAAQQVETVLERMASQTREPDAEIEIDSPDALQQFIRSEIQRANDARFAELEPTVRAFEDQRNQERIDEWCGKIPAIAEAQQFLPEEYEGEGATNLVQFMATGYMPELEARYGRGERAVQTALRMAADQLNAFAKATHQAGYQARNAELQGLSGARAPSPSAVETVGIRDEPDSVLAAADNWASRNGLN